MKKQLCILLICSFSMSLAGQKKIITGVPCTDAMAQNAKGRWIKGTFLGSNNSKETKSRADQIHDWVLKIYPQPTGVDAVWGGGAGGSNFGAKRKYYKKNDGRQTFDYSNLPHFIQFSYAALFYRYKCEYGKTHTLLPGYPGVTSTSFSIVANTTLGEMSDGDDVWTINGLPVLMRKPVSDKKDGMEFLYDGGGSTSGKILIHRKNELPYNTVSRKVYLDYCISYWTKLWDETIKGTEQMPATTEAEKKVRNERLDKDKKLKATVLKKFTDELEKTTKEGLLDSPAMLRAMYNPDQIFETDPAQGWLLITENPDYIRKNLPKHIPQFFVVNWSCYDWIAEKRICEIIEKEFPFEKLQAMIDK